MRANKNSPDSNRRLTQEGSPPATGNHLDSDRVRKVAAPAESGCDRVDPMPCHEADSPPADSKRLNRVVLRTLGKLLLALFVTLLPLFGLGVKMLVQDGRAWWSNRQASKAAENVNQDDARATASAIIAAMRASPDDPRILRTWADFLKRNSGTAADRVAALKQVVASAECTTADKAELALAFVADRQFGEAGPIIAALPESERNTVAMREAQATLHDAAGDKEGATRLRHEAWASDTENRESLFKLAMLDLGALFEEKRAQAIASLWSLAQGGDETALKAADVLSNQKALSRMQAEKLLAAVKANPKTGKRHLFIALSGVMRTHPERRETMIAEEIRKAAGYEPEDLIELAVMFDRAGASAAVLAVIPDQKAILNRDLCVLRIKALSENRRFGELESLLTARRTLPISKGHVAVLQAYLELQKGEASHAMKTLSTALTRAIGDKDDETTQRAIAFAEEQGWWDIAASGYKWAAAQGGAQGLASLEKLFAAAATMRDAGLMLSTAERIARSSSENVKALTNLAYLRLLLGTEIETVPTLLGKLQNPATAASEPLIHAFLCYRYGDKDGVRENIAHIADWTRIPPGQRAVGATLLAFSGNDTQAFDLASSLPTLALLNEEQNLWLLGQTRKP